MDLKYFVKKCISRHITKESGDLFDNVIREFAMHYNKPVHSITDINQRENKKIKGDVFEVLCQLYFETIIVKNGKPFYKYVWLLKEVPDIIKKKLILKSQDLGIDLVLQDQFGEYYAVQVKYRTHPKYKSKNVIGWKQLSTFYALVNRTGPWKKHIIFTNADYVRHIGKRDEKDKSYCIGTLRKIKKEQWYNMMTGMDIIKIDSVKIDKMITPKELRDARLKYYN